MSAYRIKLINGGFFDFVDMGQSQYTIEEVCWNLSMVCRFNGSVDPHYSVCQHAYLVSLVVPPEHALVGLCHDNSEAVLSDLNSPAKALLLAYKELEHKVEAEMFKRLGLRFPMPSSVKLADLSVLAAEIRDLQPHSSDWPGVLGIEPYAKKIKPWSAKKAREMWLERYYALTAPSGCSQ